MHSIKNEILILTFLFSTLPGCVWVEKRDWMGKDLEDLILTYGRSDYITYEDNDNGVYEKKRYTYRFESERTLSGRTYSTNRLINEVPAVTSNPTHGKPRTRHTVEWRTFYIDSKDRVYDVKGGIPVTENIKSSPNTLNQLIHSKQFDSMPQDLRDAELDRLLKKENKSSEKTENGLNKE